MKWKLAEDVAAEIREFLADAGYDSKMVDCIEDDGSAIVLVITDDADNVKFVASQLYPKFGTVRTGDHAQEGCVYIKGSDCDIEGELSDVAFMTA